MLKIIIVLCFAIVSLAGTSKLENVSMLHLVIPIKTRNTNITEHKNATTRKLRIGGSHTSIEKHPYAVSVFVDQGPKSYIAGTILNKNWILTVANNVVFRSKNKTISVRVGSNYSDIGGTVYKVEKYVIHPKHLFNSLSYDLALLKLSKPLTFSKTVKALGLTNTQMKQDQKVVVSGWSTITENNPIIGGWFKEFTLSGVNRKTCVKQYASSDYKDYKVTRSNICATSWGDDGPAEEYGAPLVANNKLYGIYSWRAIDSSIVLPSVFTNIHLCRRWIKKTIRSCA